MKTSRRSFVCGVSALGLSAMLPTWAFAATASDKQAEANAALAKLDAVNEKLHAAEQDYELAEYERQVAQDAMEDAQVKIDDASGRISDLQVQLGDRARSMYRTGSSTFVDMLLGATTFKAFTNNWGLLNDMNETDAEMVQETKDLRAEVEEQKEVYAQQEREAAVKADEAEQVKNDAANLQAEMQATYNSLSAEAAELVAAEEAARQAAAETAASTSTSNGSTGGNSSSNSSSSNKKPSTNNSSSGDNLPVIGGSDAISRAYSCIGIPYVLGGGGPKSFDCSGFVSYCLTGQTGRVLGTTWSMAGYPNVSNPQAGDIVYWDGHVGLYIGGGQMIHASLSQGKVVQSAVSWSESALGPATYKRYR
ncbi:MAG: hydrolase Nlp/P60 [Eggerthellaceae bacterium]|nr:hydrolase Nlp/P60 [Eggerthellaceae bacterium]